MTRINTNVNSLIAQRILGQQNKSLTTSLERLSTGLKINRGADDPAGLIASEKLRSEETQIQAALKNAERADQFANIAEGGLQEVSTLLIELQSLVSESASDAGLSQEEKEANQQQIDSILQSIDRVASTTSFQGTQLLNGTFDFTVSGQSTELRDLQVNGAMLNASGVQTVNITPQVSAQRAGVFLSTGGALDLDDITSSFTFEVAGTHGSREFSFASGQSLNDIRDSINNFTSVTGVSAVVSGTGIRLQSTDFGSDQFVSVNVSNDAGQAGGVLTLSTTDSNTADTGSNTAFSGVTNAIRDEGQDVEAIVNGIKAIGDGLELTVNTDALAANITLSSSSAQLGTNSFTAFSISGGGAKFNLGPEANSSNSVRLGLGNFATRNVGNSTEGFLDELGSGKGLNVVNGDVEKAQSVVSNAISEVSNLRGRIGSFQSNVVQSSIRSLSVALENTSAAESAIRDTDFASETADLTRSQILVAATTNALGIANSQPTNVLQLLG